MVQDHSRDRMTSQSWWADAFNPMENLHALADVQAFGRRAAEELADRMVAWGNGRSGDRIGGGPAAVDTEVAELAERFRADAVRAGEVSASMAEHAMSLIGILIDRFPQSRRTTTDAGRIALDSVPPGAESTRVFWIHNTSPTPVLAVRPHCGPLRSHLGRELGPDAIRFDPPVLDPLPARSTCGIEVCLRVPSDATPGSYVSVVMATNLPEVYLPLLVTVESPLADG